MGWIYDGDHTGFWTCEQCGYFLEPFDDPEYPPDEFGYNFCPYCGAEMDATEEQAGVE